MSVDIKNLKIGDVVYQSRYGHTIEAEVISNPERVESGEYIQWSCMVKCGDREYEVMETEGLKCYGPKLSREIEYTGSITTKDGVNHKDVMKLEGRP